VVRSPRARGDLDVRGEVLAVSRGGVAVLERVEQLLDSNGVPIGQPFVGKRPANGVITLRPHVPTAKLDNGACDTSMNGFSIVIAYAPVTAGPPPLDSRVVGSESGDTMIALPIPNGWIRGSSDPGPGNAASGWAGLVDGSASTSGKRATGCAPPLFEFPGRTPIELFGFAFNPAISVHWC